MEFLGIGYQELLLVLILLLVVVGPERLPTMAYQIGRAVRQMQVYARAVRDEFKDEIDYLDEQYRTVKGQVGEAQKALRAEQLSLNRDLNSSNGLGDPLLPSEPLLPALPASAAEPEFPPSVTAEPVAGEPARPPMVF